MAEIREAMNHFIAFCIFEVFPKQSGPRSLVVVAAVSVGPVMVAAIEKSIAVSMRMRH